MHAFPYLYKGDKYLLRHDDVDAIILKSFQKPREVYPSEKDRYCSSLTLNVAFLLVGKEYEHADIHHEFKMSGHLAEILESLVE